MLTEEQLAERQSGIGGSDAAPALGVSPYKSALALYLEKTQPAAPPPPTLASAFHWGNLLEPLIRQEYANQTGRVIRVPPGTMRHAKYPFVLAHLDGITEDGRVFEAKTARSADGWGNPGTDEVPHHYLIQVQHYLAITGFEFADIAVLIAGNDFRLYEVAADAELQQMIIDGEAEFWDRVRKEQPPNPDFTRPDVHEIVRRMYPGTDGRTLIATESDEAFRRSYEEASEKAKQYGQLANTAKAHLLNVMGSASRLLFPAEGVELRRKETTRKEYTVAASTYIDSRFTKIKEVADV